jgi:hypothetical protein
MAVAGCRGFEAAEHRYQLAPEAILPEGLKNAPDEIREVYRFAVVEITDDGVTIGGAGTTSRAQCDLDWFHVLHPLSKPCYTLNLGLRSRESKKC